MNVCLRLGDRIATFLHKKQCISYAVILAVNADVYIVCSVCLHSVVLYVYVVHKINEFDCELLSCCT